MLQAVAQYYPQYKTYYQQLFGQQNTVPAAYNEALQAAAAGVAATYDLPARIPFK